MNFRLGAPPLDSPRREGMVVIESVRWGWGLHVLFPNGGGSLACFFTTRSPAKKSAQGQQRPPVQELSPNLLPFAMTQLFD